MNELYQEAKLEEEPGKGLSFESTLMLLARYALIDESEALTCVSALYPLFTTRVLIFDEFPYAQPRGMGDKASAAGTG
jgi:hypothetical protein